MKTSELHKKSTAELHHELCALRGRDASAHAGVDLGFGDQRDIGRPAGHQAHRHVEE